MREKTLDDGPAAAPAGDLAAHRNDRPATEWDVPRGWRGPTLRRPLSDLPTLPRVKALVERHERQIAVLSDSIRSGQHQPIFRSRQDIEAEAHATEDALTSALDCILTMFRRGEDHPAPATPNEAATDGRPGPTDGTNLLGDAIDRIHEYLELVASSVLRADDAAWAIKAASRRQLALLTSLRQLGAIDDIAFAFHAVRLRHDFGATRLNLARSWMEQGRDELDIEWMMRKTHNHVHGAADVAGLAEVLAAARDWGRLGDHPETGAPVFVKAGARGRMYAQLGRRSDATWKHYQRVALPGPGDGEAGGELGAADGATAAGADGAADHVADRPADGALNPAAHGRAVDPAAVTLEQAVRILADKIRLWSPWCTDPKSGRPIFLRQNNQRRYLQLGRSPKAGGSEPVVRASLPPGVTPDTLTIEQASRALHRKMVQDRPLGRDPETGENVYARDGRWGGYVQLGERHRDGPRPKIVSLPNGAPPDDTDLATALEILRPVVWRNLGNHPVLGTPVTVQSEGRWGPFVCSKAGAITIPEGFDPATLTLAEAVRFLNTKDELGSWRRETRTAFRDALEDGDPPDPQGRIMEARAQQLNALQEAPYLEDISDTTLRRAMGFLHDRFEEAREEAGA